MRFYRKNPIHNFTERVMGQGELSVVVTAASGTVALLEASVAVSKESVLLTHRLTGNDGMVPTLTVSVPGAELSTGGGSPSTEVLVRVFMPGYRTVTRRVQVFADATVYLQVDMQPIVRNCFIKEGETAVG